MISSYLNDYVANFHLFEIVRPHPLDTALGVSEKTKLPDFVVLSISPLSDHWRLSDGSRED